jgi:prevent-host-death family protein
MPTANVHQAKTQLSKLIDAALKGEEVIIARNGVPAVRLVPVESLMPNRRGGWLRGRVKVLDPDWDKPDPEIERLFYESVLFPEDNPAPIPVAAEDDPAGKDDGAPAR